MEMNTHEVVINCEIKDTVVEHIHEKDISKKKIHITNTKQ